MTERSVTATEAIPVKVENRGSGAVAKVVETGTAGVAEVTRGQVSRIKLSTKVIKPGKPMVVLRSRPTAGDKLVALTFDDGPVAGQTDKILDVLAQKQVKATFFMLGGRVKAQPALARRVKDEGHLVGNHSLGHKNLPKEKPAEIRRQIAGGASAIREGDRRRPGVVPPALRRRERQGVGGDADAEAPRRDVGHRHARLEEARRPAAGQERGEARQAGCRDPACTMAASTAGRPSRRCRRSSTSSGRRATRS